MTNNNNNNNDSSLEEILKSGEHITIKLPNGDRVVGMVIHAGDKKGIFRFYGERIRKVQGNKPQILPTDTPHKILRDKSMDWRERREVNEYEEHLAKREWAREYFEWMLEAGVFVPKEEVKPKVRFPKKWTKRDGWRSTR
jgi:hypothetical protein